MRRFILMITEKDGTINFESENDGFNTVELIAFLEMKKHDIVVQAEAQTTYDRTMIRSGKNFKIVESEETK